jgi:hypothetical protein
VRRSLTAECPPIASTLASIANLLNDLVDVGAVPHVVSELTGASRTYSHFRRVSLGRRRVIIHDAVALIWRGSQSPSPNTENPPFNPGDSALRRRQVWIEKPCELAVKIGFAQPRRNRVGIMLVGGASVHGEGVLT